MLTTHSKVTLFFMYWVSCSAWAGLASSNDPQATRLRVTNQCVQVIWVQQDYKNYTQDGIVVQVPPNQSFDYSIPEQGLAATRFWAKIDCNQHGFDCKVGETTGVPTALDQGIQHGPFAPDINSKLEVTWGCADAIFKNNPGLCAANPSDPAHHLDNHTWWNGSAVDGYTLPYQIIVKNHNGTCVDITSGKVVENPGVDCGGLKPTLCPTDENLSTEGQYSKINGIDVTHVNLQWLDPSTQQPVGCFSPCSKLTVAQGSDGGSTAGGWKGLLGGLTPESPQANKYCCPTPPISSAECIAGPASRSVYHHSVKETQKCNAYTYAYDDANGLAQCHAQIQLELVFCPKASIHPDTTGGSGNNPDTSTGETPTPPAVGGFPLQFNFNPAFGIRVFLNDTPVENAQVWQSKTFPADSVLKANQAEKWGSCALTIGQDNVSVGGGELCSRLNMVKEGTGKVHVYLPADIPNNAVPNDLPSSSTPDATGGGTTPVAPKYIVFGMNGDQWANFKSQVVTNGTKVALDTLGNDHRIDLIVHQAQTTASCVLGKVGDDLEIVKDTGLLCKSGLVLITQNNGDYYVGIPNPLPVPTGQKAFGLGIAAGMSVTISGKTIRWDSSDKTVYLPEGPSQILMNGNNGLTRTCSVMLDGSRLTWPKTTDCEGLVENGGILYFPAF